MALNLTYFISKRQNNMKKIREKCHLLPNKLSTINKTIDMLISEATNILLSDFSTGQVSFRGKQVVGEYPYTNKKSYEHILKLDDPTATNKQKVERALRCKQYAALLTLSQNVACCEDFKCWKEFNVKKANWKWFVLCPINKILIVLGERKNNFFLITAYHLMGNGVKKQIEKYNASKNKQ